MPNRLKRWNGTTWITILDDALYLPIGGGTATGNITAPTFTSSVAIGTPPFTVTSTTKVPNLNADMLDGIDSLTLTNRLDALEAATAAPGWVNLFMINSWKNYDQTWNPAQYCKIGTIVYLRGLIAGGTVNAQAFTLPVGFRPWKNELFATDMNLNQHCRISCHSNGDVHVTGSANGTNLHVGLSGIYFDTAVPSTALPVTSGLDLWIDGKLATGWSFTSGINVAGYVERSTNARTFLAGGTGAVTRGSDGIITFNGTNYLSWSGNTGMNVGNFTVFAVFKENVEQTYCRVVAYGASSGTDYGTPNSFSANSGNTDTHFLIERDTSSPHARVTGTGPSPWEVYIARAQADGVIAAWRGATYNTTNTKTGTFGVATGGIAIGVGLNAGAPVAGNMLNGEVLEILVYNRALTDVEMGNVYGYLAQRHAEW